MDKIEPHLAFREWWLSDKGQKYMRLVAKTNNWPWPWIEEMAKEVYVWAADPENPKRYKKLWGRTLVNRCHNNIRFAREQDRREKLMSAEQEQQHYATKRRSGHSNKGFSRAGDV